MQAKGARQSRGSRRHQKQLFTRLQVLVLAHRVARASLVSELVVPMNACIRVLRVELLQELTKRPLLLRSTSIFGMLTIRGATADVANANGMRVETLAVGPDHVDGTSLVDGTIAVNHEVITDTFPTLSLVPTVDVSHGEVLAFRRGGAVNDNFSNPTCHKFCKLGE